MTTFDYEHAIEAVREAQRLADLNAVRHAVQINHERHVWEVVPWYDADNQNVVETCKPCGVVYA